MTTPPTTKRCNACEEVLPLEQFHRASARRDGRQSNCRACIAAYNRDRRARLAAENPEQVARNREANKLYQAAWRAENRPRARGYSRTYYARHKDRILERRKADRAARKDAAWLAAAEAALEAE